MTETPAPGKTYPVELLGRTVTITQLTDGQVMLLGRDATLLQKLGPEPGNATKIMRLTNRIMALFESAFPVEDDFEYALDMMAAGKLTTQRLTEVLMSAFEQEAEAKPKPAVRRGRPARAK